MAFGASATAAHIQQRVLKLNSIKTMQLMLQLHGHILCLRLRQLSWECDLRSLRRVVATSMRAAVPDNASMMHNIPDPREDLESRSPNLEPYTTKGTL